MPRDQIKVLIAVADETTFETVKSQLDQIITLPFTVHCESDLDQVSKAIVRDEFDVFLLDYQLIKAKGLQSLQKARAQNKEVPVIMLVSSGEKKVDTDALHAGLTRFVLTEAIDTQIIRECLSQVLSKISLQNGKDYFQQEKLALTSNIARSLAHDVRNPLTNINLAQDQLSEAITEDDTLELYLDIIKRNTQKINHLIDELLRSSKPPVLQLRPQTLNEVLEKALAQIQNHPNSKAIKIEKQYDEKMSPISADAEKLTQAFYNVIENALEAMQSDQGVLRLKTQQRGQQQAVQIYDNGPGISQEAINQLFDAFYTDKNGKKGLGLTFTQTIINAHGGSISVESDLEEGTCFHIIFDPTN